MKAIILTALLSILSGCGQVTNLELREISDACGGVEKVQKMWIDLYKTKAYCVDGSKAGNW